MRLIDADWVLAHIKPYELSDEDWSVTGGTAIRLIHNAIDQAPTIDAVPVVRCKDCKYMIQWADGRYCTVWDGVNGMGDDGFCNYGERRGDNNNG